LKFHSIKILLLFVIIQYFFTHINKHHLALARKQYRRPISKQSESDHIVSYNYYYPKFLLIVVKKTLIVYAFRRVCKNCNEFFCNHAYLMRMCKLLKNIKMYFGDRFLSSIMHLDNILSKRIPFYFNRIQTIYEFYWYHLKFIEFFSLLKIMNQI